MCSRCVLMATLALVSVWLLAVPAGAQPREFHTFNVSNDMMEDDDGAVAGRITVRQKGFKDQVVEFDLGPGEAEGLPWESKLQAGKESDCKVVVEFKRSQKWPGCPWPAPKQKTVVPDCKDGEVEFFREDCSLKAN